MAVEQADAGRAALSGASAQASSSLSQLAFRVDEEQLGAPLRDRLPLSVQHQLLPEGTAIAPRNGAHLVELLPHLPPEQVRGASLPLHESRRPRMRKLGEFGSLAGSNAMMRCAGCPRYNPVALELSCVFAWGQSDPAIRSADPLYKSIKVAASLLAAVQLPLSRGTPCPQTFWKTEGAKSPAELKLEYTWPTTVADEHGLCLSCAVVRLAKLGEGTRAARVAVGAEARS